MEALLAGDIDLAVHSAKDLPVVPAEGIVIGAVPSREDPRDAVVARDKLTLAELPKGALVGTGSPRRAAQLRALGLDLSVVPVRGNVDTRLAHVGGDTSMRWCWPSPDSVGWERLRRDPPRSSTRRASSRPPRKRALAVECRADDLAAREVLAAFDDAGARACITAERALLASLEAGCSAPIGALAEIHADPAELTLTAVVTAADGSDAVRRTLTGVVTDPAGVGRRLAADLIASGADKMMGSSS